MTRIVIARYSHQTHAEVPLDYSERKSGIQVIKDIDPYKSMITGERIGSRRQHKDHLKAHGCIEVGNEKMETNIVPTKSKVRKEILRDQLATMSHADVRQVIQNEIRNRRGY